VRVSWPRLFAAWFAGVGVNAVLPARGGDALKLYLAKRRIPGATYPTLAATLVVLTLFDTLVAGSLLLWAITAGVLPGLDVLPNLPSLDFGWFFLHPKLGLALLGGTLVLLLLLLVWAGRRIEAFWQRVRQGFVVLRDRRRYLRSVAFWQLVDWSLRIATIFCLLQAFGLPATAYNAFLVQVAASVAGAFPLSPGGIGTTEALLVYVLRGAASRTAVVSFGVGMRITITAVNAAFGFFIILVTLRTLDFRRVAGSPKDEAEKMAA
jgi:uncharacterized membrane protein YbhN (UPF0104 family)